MIFRSYSSTGVLQTVPYFSPFIGAIDGLNQSFTSNRPLGVTKHDFVVLLNGVVVASTDFDYFYPDTIVMVAAPNLGDRLEFILFGRTGE